MSDSNYLAHHGTIGMKWGVRKYQNSDGSLTPEGRKRYGVGPERSSQKYSRAAVAGMEAKYQAKRAGKSIGNAVKSAPKNVSNAAKKTASDLSRMHKEAVQASKVRRHKAKQERFEARQRRREEKAERIARKIAERESKKTLKELKDEFDEARMNDARKKVAALLNKQDRIREKAFLKEQEKILKKEMKQLKKDAEKEAKSRFSRNKIKDLSDEELNARIKRLETEIKLASLEAQRAAPKTTAAAKWISDTVGRGASEGVSKLVGTTAVKYGKQALGLTDEDINEFVRLTKKK